jgi:hypothetical protein
MDWSQLEAEFRPKKLQKSEFEWVNIIVDTSVKNAHKTPLNFSIIFEVSTIGRKAYFDKQSDLNTIFDFFKKI